MSEDDTKEARAERHLQRLQHDVLSCNDAEQGFYFTAVRLHGVMLQMRDTTSHINDTAIIGDVGRMQVRFSELYRDLMQLQQDYVAKHRHAANQVSLAKGE